MCVYYPVRTVFLLKNWVNFLPLGSVQWIKPSAAGLLKRIPEFDHSSNKFVADKVAVKHNFLRLFR